MHSIYTRAEFVTTLVDMLKLNEVTTAPKFEDVAADAVYTDAIAEAKLAGFIQGYGAISLYRLCFSSFIFMIQCRESHREIIKAGISSRRLY